MTVLQLNPKLVHITLVLNLSIFYSVVLKLFMPHIGIFRSLLNQFLNQKFQKKSGLKLSEISTSLFNMKRTLVPMPGLVEDAKVGLFIDSFENLITVLPTKTKPKRILLVSSYVNTFFLSFIVQCQNKNKKAII